MRSLTDRLLDGEKQAVLEFYNLYSPKILRYLLKKLPTKDDAEEITNDVFLEAIDALPFFQQKSSLSTWVYKIAHNKSVDYYRKRKIKSIVLSQIPLLQIMASEIHEPEFQFEKNRLRDKIEFTLRGMSHKYRQVLKLYYEEEMPVKEIALALNLSFKATESLLFRARQSFKKSYEKS